MSSVCVLVYAQVGTSTAGLRFWCMRGALELLIRFKSEETVRLPGWGEIGFAGETEVISRSSV